MNNKQKLGYTLLGAGIMAVGITIGQFITPNIEAQSNGVFNKITCREIEVVGSKGKKAIVLASEVTVSELQGKKYEHWENKMVFYNREEKQAIELLVDKYSSEILLNDREGDRGVWLHSGREFFADTNKVVVYQPDKAGPEKYKHQGASLQSSGKSGFLDTEEFSSLSLNNLNNSIISLKSGDAEDDVSSYEGKSIRINSDREKNSIEFWNPQGRIGIDLTSTKNLNYVYLFDQQEERATGLFADDDEKYGNGVFTIDKSR